MRSRAFGPVPCGSVHASCGAGSEGVFEAGEGAVLNVGGIGPGRVQEYRTGHSSHACTPVTGFPKRSTAHASAASGNVCPFDDGAMVFVTGVLVAPDYVAADRAVQGEVAQGGEQGFDAVQSGTVGRCDAIGLGLAILAQQPAPERLEVKPPCWPRPPCTATGSSPQLFSVACKRPAAEGTIIRIIKHPPRITDPVYAKPDLAPPTRRSRRYRAHINGL